MGTYSLDEIRLAISLLIIGQQFLITIVFLKGRPIESAQWIGALLVLSAITYLIQSNMPLREVFSPVALIVSALAIALPYLLWEFSIAIFESQSVPRHIRFSLYIVPAFFWFALASDPTKTSGFVPITGLVHQIVALAVIAMTVTSIYRNRCDDLLEPRRRYRAFFVLFIAFQTAAIISIEMILGFSNFPDWLEMANVLMIEVLTLGLMLPLLNLNDRILWGAKSHEQGTSGTPPTDALSPANRVLHDALSTSMNTGFYRTQGLGIRELADELKVPEHQLRKLINQNLGYRNFSAFLNHYRISEAKEQLSSDKTVRTPVLTIAMDLGYGSIGPFNRAFKETTGVTPSEFRRQNFRQTLADSE